MAGTTISGSYLTTTIFNDPATQNPATIASGATLLATGTPGAYAALYAAAGTDWTITNFGSIEGLPGASNGIGVSVASDSLILNQASGMIDGGSQGVVLAAGGTIVNQGTVYGYNQGISLTAGGSIVNRGSIGAGNAGADTGAADSDAVLLGAGGSVTNQSGGTIASYNGVVANAGAPPTVINAGAIAGDTTHSQAKGVQLNAGGSVTNQSGGAITGATGVYGGGGGALTVVNAGSITGSNDEGNGIFLDAGGSVTNQSGGTIAGYYGIRGEGQPLTIQNAGSIAGGSGFGISLLAGGDVTNHSGGTISGRLGILDRAGALTVENAGTISATQAAVYFAAGYTNRLIVDPGAGFVGLVSGGDTASSTTAVSTLELTSAAASGTLSGLGIQFTGFIQTTIDAGASWTLTGANALPAGTTVTNAGTLTLLDATLSDAGDFINNGTILLDPSGLTLVDLTGTGVTTIEAGTTLTVLGTVTTGETVAFTGTTDELGANPTAFAGQINGFTFGDTIQLAGVLDGTSAEIVNGNTLQIDRSGNPPVDLTLDPGVSYAGDLYTVSPTGAVTETEIPCFLRDTRIRSATGDVAVQDLAIGDRVLTLSGQFRPITWIGTGQVLVSPGRRSAATPIIVRKSALADNVPYHDLRLTKGHSLFIDGVLIPAEFLVNHRSIQWDDHKRQVEFYHIELDAHDVLIANGTPSESFRDDGNRWLFQNTNVNWDQPAKPPCAPVLTGGPIVDTAWKRLLDRTAPRPGLTLTDDPDLHLLIDGQRLDATTRTNASLSFTLSHPHTAIRIVSRAAAPQELGLARDPRRLGVALKSITLHQGTRPLTIDAADARLIDGFHPFEADNAIRWTDGDATLPAALFDGFDAPMELLLQFGGSTRYPAFAVAGQPAATRAHGKPEGPANEQDDNGHLYHGRHAVVGCG